jgi:hypothetical protein
VALAFTIPIIEAMCWSSPMKRTTSSARYRYDAWGHLLEKSGIFAEINPYRWEMGKGRYKGKWIVKGKSSSLNSYIGKDRF